MSHFDLRWLEFLTWVRSHDLLANSCEFFKVPGQKSKKTYGGPKGPAIISFYLMRPNMIWRSFADFFNKYPKNILKILKISKCKNLKNLKFFKFSSLLIQVKLLESNNSSQFRVMTRDIQESWRVKLTRVTWLFPSQTPSDLSHKKSRVESASLTRDRTQH